MRHPPVGVSEDCLETAKLPPRIERMNRYDKERVILRVKCSEDQESVTQPPGHLSLVCPFERSDEGIGCGSHEERGKCLHPCFVTIANKKRPKCCEKTRKTSRGLIEQFSYQEVYDDNGGNTTDNAETTNRQDIVAKDTLPRVKYEVVERRVNVAD